MTEGLLELLGCELFLMYLENLDYLISDLLIFKFFIEVSLKVYDFFRLLILFFFLFLNLFQLSILFICLYMTYFRLYHAFILLSIHCFPGTHFP